MTTFTDRIQTAFKHAQDLNPQITKKGLAEACNVSKSAVSAWFSGQSKSITPQNAETAAKYLNVSERWLVNGAGEMIRTNVVVFDDEEPDSDEYVAIPEYRISLQAGDGVQEDSLSIKEIEDSTLTYYKRDFFIKRHLNPECCKRFRVRGSSMEPLLWDGDSILVDCSPQDILDGKIYAFALQGRLRVKYIYTMLKGGYLIKSANTDYPDEVLGDDELNTFHLIGRVRDRSGDSIF